MAGNPIIFIVDDDEAVRDSLSMLIESVGMKTETFGSCREFLAKTALPQHACLLLDVHMPEMSGLQLQDELAKRGVELPVIVMTGQADVPLAVRAMKAGAADFIEKPFTEELMLEAIERVLKAPSARPAADAAVKQRLARLSPREHEVLLQMVAGNPNKVAAHNSASARARSKSTARVSWKRQRRAACRSWCAWRCPPASSPAPGERWIYRARTDTKPGAGSTLTMRKVCSGPPGSRTVMYSSGRKFCFSKWTTGSSSASPAA